MAEHGSLQYDPFPVCIGGWQKLVETHEARLLVMESSRLEVRDSIRVWSNILQEGLADLSMQMKAISQVIRWVQQRHPETATEIDSVVSRNLFKVEEQMQAMSRKIQEDPDVVARLSKVEERLQILQSTIQETQRHSHQEVQRSHVDLQRNHDQVVDHIHVLEQLCLRMEQKQNTYLLESPQQLLSLLHRRPQPQTQSEQTLWPHQQRIHVKKYDSTLPMAQEQTATNYVQKHSGIAKCTPACRGQEHDLNQEVPLRRSPIPRCGARRQSPYVPAGGVAQPSLRQESATTVPRELAVCSGRSMSREWERRRQ